MSGGVYLNAHFNVAVLLDQQGNASQAIRHYRKALRIEPNFSQAEARLDVLLSSRGSAEPTL